MTAYHTPAMPPLLALPHEVLHCILRGVDPQDLPRISQTCHALYAFLKDNQMLSKAVYLHTMDYTPRSNAAEPIWTEKIRKIVKLEHIFSGTNLENKLQHIEFVGQTVTELLQTARAPSNPDAPELQTVNFLQHHFKSKQNQDAFLRHSELFDRARYQDRVSFVRQPFPARQASAKLHCLYGCPLENAGKRRSQRTYPYACSKVYDLRNYTQKTKWGPFMEDGSGNVDWERVEAIMVTLGYNLRRFDDRAIPSVSDVWETPFLDAVPDSYLSGEIPFAKQIIEKSKENSELDAQDPYGISGTYMRIVCFLDYSDLFAYNFTHPEQPADEPRVAYDASEVVRMIKMEIKVVRIEPPGPDDHPDYPVVYFRGNSRSSGMMWDPNANSSIRGKGHVRVTKEGEVHWTSFSIYGGEERWRSEGIQVGGIRSQRGVIGNWFDKDYDIRGPAGPTAFWKISDDIEDFDPNSIPDMDDDSEDEDDSDYELVFELGTDGLIHQSS